MPHIILENTPSNITLARYIRDLNREQDSAVDVEFRAENREIHFSGEIIYVPETMQKGQDFTVVEGEFVTLHGESCIIDRNRAKTVNVHLDSELVSEINAIREYISRNTHESVVQPLRDGTQHDILLEMLRRGIDQLKDDLGLN